MAARNAAGEVVVDVEHDRVAVGDERIERQHLGRNATGRYRELEAFQELHRPARPYAPVSEQTAAEAKRDLAVAGAHHQRRHEIGNDDHIVADLVTPLVVRTGNREITLRFRGGLLGHWSVWTRGAVKLLERLKLSVSAGAVPPEVLALDSFVTDCNSVVFDVDHDFSGCIPGCHEILRRQGLMTSIECLDPHEKLSPGQSDGIDRLYATYPELHDDAFVAANIERWRT